MAMTNCHALFVKEAASCTDCVRARRAYSGSLFLVCVYHTDIMVRYFCPNDKSLALFSPFGTLIFVRLRNGAYEEIRLD